MKARLELCPLEPRDAPRGSPLGFDHSPAVVPAAPPHYSGAWLQRLRDRLHPAPPTPVVPAVPAPTYDVAGEAVRVWETQPAAPALRAAGAALVLVYGETVGAAPAFAGTPFANERAGNDGLDVYVAVGWPGWQTDANDLRRTVWHVSGHSLDLAAGAADDYPQGLLASGAPAWQSLYYSGEAFTTDYSRSSPQECFAEAYVAYCTHPQNLSPATYQFVDGCVTGRTG